MKEKVIIHISREHGSLGHVVGEKLAEKLKCNLYDKKLIEEIAEEHGLDKEFLKEYEESVNLLNTDVTGAAQKIEAAGIFPQAVIAERAIPHCNVCFVTGEEMQTELGAFLEIMFEKAPQSIGGALPGDDFYCILK